MRLRTGFVGALLAAAVAFAQVKSTGATLVRAVEFAEQCATAETIVVGTVRAVESRRMATAPSLFETRVTLAVDEVVAGAAPGELTLRLAGGEVGAIRQSIDGMPEFAAGERYVVFLEREQDPPLVSPIVGFNQGLYRVARLDGADVVRDRAGGALRPSAAAALASRAASPTGRTRAAPASLAEFLAAVRAARPRP